MDIIIRVVATLLALGTGYLLKLAANWIRSKLDDKQEEKFNLFLYELVHAAEQSFPELPLSSAKKKKDTPFWRTLFV